ncbi:ankyrin repeat-containing domain protein [Microdochium trichocladiopsis]|uniref:Ankyrin repeat-containing domain protein n=1 Tax=Microdochium trichocladiopsis TaxID=1682393 RepID=A0A9P8XSC9_9PEZI|nr:ankyrin repeat-containing domain protein [Microdochium trichocladiopsis]KAH7014630.1 ankyrin repeat-containing domain protein [Microdochium trichocladiopsis]
MVPTDDAITILPKVNGSSTVRMIEELIASGVDATPANDASRTPLHVLSNIRPDVLDNINLDRPGQTLALNVLLEQLNRASNAAPSRVNAANVDGITPLHLAVATSAYHIRRLLESGADLARPNKEGRTPLHYAVQDADGNVVSMLLQAVEASREKQQVGNSPPGYSAAVTLRAFVNT